MTRNFSDNNAGANAGIIEEEPQVQPVVSLLEKYSSLHRRIDEARKAYSQRQLEIESVEGELHQLVEIDRIADRRAIEVAISEKGTLLETLETLTLTDLVEAQEAEFLAKSNRESVLFREEKATQINQDDRNQFLNASKTFREKVRTLCLRGELFGVTPSVALLTVHKTLHGSIPSQTVQTSNVDLKKDDDSNCIVNVDLLWGDGNGGISCSEDVGYQEEVEGLLKQLRAQNESNEKKQKEVHEAKEKLHSLVEAKGKREKQKKDLESQCERLQKDVRDVESQIEALNEQTKEAVELTKQFRKENDTTPQEATTSASTTNGGTTRSKKKPSLPYNPYARVNRRKPSNSESCENSTANNASSNANMISPIPEASNANRNSFEVRHAKHGMNGCQSFSPSTSTKRRRQTHAKSKQGRPSRRFGESSFRAPREQSLMRDDLSSNGSGQGTTDHKRKNVLSALKDLEDTDEDEDDLSWLNTKPLFSKRLRRASSSS